MKAARWQQVKGILAGALEHEGTARRDFLAQACAGDTTLVGEVNSFLAQTDDQLEEFAAGITGERNAGRRIGAYRLVRELGRGGMGAVWLATRADEKFQQTAAIKLLKRGTDTEEVLRRFRAERQILARLNHPNIARLFDGGETDDGLPFFVMEYVEGVPITQYAREQKLSISERLVLFRLACGAVSYAHHNLVIHRDLKPANVLVTPAGEMKLLDFGIAKLVQADGENPHPPTMTIQRVMTPEYASPEQLTGGAITPVSDVYSLGVILYELLAGRRPYHLKTRAPDEFARAITKEEPERPSTAAIRNNPGSPIRVAERKRLRGDLDNIVLKALRKEPGERYPTVADFGEDIRRHLEQQPIRARPRTAGYVARRFIARQKAQLATAVALCVIGALLGSIVSRKASSHSLTIPAKSTAALLQEKPSQKETARAPTADPEAYQLYLRAHDLIVNAHINQMKTVIPQGIQLLQEALVRDPDFLLAHCCLALGHDTLYWFGIDRTPERLARAEAEVETATRLQPDAGETHRARGQHLYWGYRDFEGARAEFSAAMRALPNDASILALTALIDRRLGRWDDSVREMEKALEINPLDIVNLRQVALTYQKLRDYRQITSTCERILAIDPNDAHFRAAKAAVSFDRDGDTRDLDAILPVVLTWDLHEAPQVSALAIDLALSEHNEDLATAGLKAIPDEGFIDRAAVTYPRGWFEGLVARSHGDRLRAEEAFLRARAETEKRTRETTNNAKALSVLGLLDAMLGRKEEALEEGKRAAELLPVSKDAFDGPEMVVNLALICALIGEKDLALNYLTRVTALPTFSLTYGRLKYYPLWDNLRGDERFEKIVANAAPKGLL